jgi:prepilin-type N-terminal cleavage/methylation domain-containing protein
MIRNSPQRAVRAGIPFVINTADGKSHEARQSWKIAVGRTRVRRTSHFRLPNCAERGRESVLGFTLLELLIVMSIVVMLMLLIAPAFTTIKSSGDVTSAAYTVKGALDTARTYAKANNTYTWVGFLEENVANPVSPNTDAPKVGRLIMSIVASKDGTNVYGSTGAATIDATRLIQVGKLIKIENVHVPLFALGTGAGDTFDARPSPSPASDANNSRFGELNAAPPNTAPLTTPHNFQYPVGNPAPAAQFTFSRLFEFSSRGEGRVIGDTVIRRVVEIGLLPTHGTATPPPSGSGIGGSIFAGNVVAVQINGFAGDVRVFRR